MQVIFTEKSYKTRANGVVCLKKTLGYTRMCVSNAALANYSGLYVKHTKKGGKLWQAHKKLELD